MRGLICVLVVGLVVAVVVAQRPAAKPKFKLGKDTTYITGPLDADGFVDYETALNEKLRGTIKPEENAVPLLLEAECCGRFAACA